MTPNTHGLKPMSLDDLDKKGPPPFTRGPSVFPEFYALWNQVTGSADMTGGLSLRDLFAVVALHGLAAGATATEPDDAIRLYAETAYRMADTMLFARTAPERVSA